MNYPSRLHQLSSLIAALALAAPLAALAQPSHDSRDNHRDQPHEQQHPQAHQEPQRGRPAPRAEEHRNNDHSYAFQQQDRQRLEKHYKSILGHVDRSHRPHFEAGQKLPPQYRGVITRAPENLRRRLPPPPAGYQIGYYQGYTLVYDPTTLAILSVIDLLNQ